MKIMTTKIREGSLSQAVALGLQEMGHDVYALSDGKDIRLADYWGPKTIEPDTQVLINTAGITDNNPVGSWDIRRLDQIVSVNLIGAMQLTESFLKATMYNPAPKLIVHVGSMGARKVFTNCAPYCAAKAGLSHYVACAGYELRTEGKFNIIGIHPDNIRDTPMTRRVQRDLAENRGMSQEQIDKIYERAIPVDYLAGFIVDLIARTENWKWINGENFYLGAGDKRGG